MDCPQTDWLSNEKFLRRLHDRAVQERIPLVGTFALTNRCNLRCIHCYVGDKRCQPASRELGTQAVLRVLVRVGVEDLTGVASASFRLDGGEWRPLDDLANLTGRATVRAFGAHALEVRVTDAAGNTGTAAITFDIERPEQRPPSGRSVVLVIAFTVAAAVAAIARSRRGGDCRAQPPHG